MKLQNINLDKIITNLNQPRKYFSQEKMEELKESIKNNGLIQPIIVRKVENIVQNKYEIIAGERRYRACKSLGFENVQCVVIQAGDSKSYEYSVLENIQRENLNPIEEAESYVMLMEVYGYTQENMAQKLGKTRSAISNKIRLLKLPEAIKSYVRTGKLSYGHARTLLGLKDNFEVEKIAKKIIEKNYTVRDVEKIVKKYNEFQDNEVKIFKKEYENFDIERYDNIKTEDNEEKEMLENKLREFFETKVEIKGELNKRGKIEIEYYDYEDLAKIVTLLGIDFE